MGQTTTEQFRLKLVQLITDSDPGTRLPTDGELSNRFGISAKSVYRVMRGLREEGRIVRIRGKGTFVPGVEDEASAPEASECARRVTSEEQLACYFRDRIASGELRSGNALPQVKMVRKTFRVGPATACRAYARLVREGLATKIGKSYFVGPPPKLSSGQKPQRIHFFYDSATDPARVFSWGDVAGASFIHMEAELSRFGCMLEYHLIEEFRHLAEEWCISGSGPYGILLHNLNERHIPVLLPSLTKVAGFRNWSRRPGILAHWHYGDYRILPPRVTVLPSGGIIGATARAAARFLVERGRGRAAVLHDEKYNNIHWSLWILLRLSRHVKGLDPDFDLRLFVKPGTPGEGMDSYLKRQFRYARTGARERLAEDGMSEETIRERVCLFDSVSDTIRRNRDIGLWAVTSDINAHGVMQAAESHRLRIPHDLALLGLENNPAYYHLNISTCRLEPDRLGYQMAHALLRDLRLNLGPSGTLRTEASIVERMTT